MKYIISILMCCLIATAYCQNHAESKAIVKVIMADTNTSSLTNMILDIHLKKFRWMAEKKTDSLGFLLADNVHYIHSNSWRETKDEVLDNNRTEKLKYRDVKVHESEVRIYGSTGIVTGKGTFYVTMEGKELEFNLYYTEVYTQTPDGIKLVSRHACKY